MLVRFRANVVQIKKGFQIFRLKPFVVLLPLQDLNLRPPD